MKHVFISYVRDTSELVDKLADRLRAFGVHVWLDREQLAPGVRWKDAIREAIAQGAFFIACFSQEYLLRTRTYMNEELTLAIDELRQRRTDQSWFIPVLVNPCTPPDRSIGPGETLSSLQHVALYQDWEDGLRRIVSLISPGNRLGRELRSRVRSEHVDGGTVPPNDLVAIDFGTSVSCIAVLDDDMNPFFIPAPNGRAFIPSVITFDSNMDYCVGWDAVDLATTYPDRTVFNVKRCLGSSQPLAIGNGNLSPEVIVSLIVGSLKKNAEEYLDRQITRALVSMPANFNIPQANALARAIDMAGITVERLIGEPNAASLLLHRVLGASQGIGSDFYVVTLDLGGGTFDVSVLNVGEGVYEALAVTGDNSLGGSDYDELLFRHALSEAETRLGSNRTLTPRDRMRLRLEVIRTKLALSSTEHTAILVPDVEVSGQGLEDVHIGVTRDGFRHVTAALDGRVEMCIRRALRIAHMEPSQVDMVLLAGQGLKIFTVVDLVERIFPKTPKEKRFQEAAVVRGLCQYTGVLTGRVAELLLLDANYTSIGIKAISCDHEQGQAVNDAGECDFWLSSNSSKNNDTLQILPVSTTIPTIKTLRGRAIGGRDPELVVVEGSTLDDQSETVIVKHIFSGLQEGDECEIQVEADADRTLVLWTANPRTKEIHGYQLNNPFKELLGGTTKPTQYIQRRFTAGMAAEGFRILPVIKVGTTATRT